MLPGTYNTPPIASEPPSVALVSSASSSANLSSYTFAGMALGDADPTRVILVAVVGLDVGSIVPTGCTVAGVTATLVASGVSITATGSAQIYAVALPSGTTGDVVVTCSGAIGRVAVIVWRALNMTSLTPYDTATSDADPAVLDCNTTGACIAVACGFWNNTTPAAWTGLTEDVDDTVEGSQYTGASATINTAATPRSISVNCGTTSYAVGAAAVFM